MKKASVKMADQDIPELKRDELGKGVRGKYLKHFMQGSNVVVLQLEIQKAFPTSEAVNKALASMLAFAQETQGLTGRSSRTPRKRAAAQLQRYATNSKMGIRIAYPWLALIASIVFAVLWRTTGSRLNVWVAALQVLYAGYEFLMHARVLCAGECNIQIDLLLIYPVLLVLSFVALRKSVRAHKRSKPAA